MADYLLLYSGGAMPETEEEQAMVMKAWDSWMHDLGSTLKDGGNPFTPGAAKKISSGGSVSEGSVAPTASGCSAASSISSAIVCEGAGPSKTARLHFCLGRFTSSWSAARPAGR